MALFAKCLLFLLVAVAVNSQDDYFGNFGFTNPNFEIESSVPRLPLKRIKYNTAENDFKNTVLGACKNMRKSDSINCQKFADQHSDLIKNILDTIPSKDICQKSKTTSTLEKDEILECGICFGSVDAVNNALLRGEYKNESAKLLKNSCDSLPSKYYEKCNEFLTFYGERIIELLKTYSASNICSKIGKCFGKGQPSEKLSRLRRQLGANKCTWGPSYWCSSRETASSCGATDYCDKNGYGQN